MAEIRTAQEKVSVVKKGTASNNVQTADSLGTRIRQSRKRLGLSQQELAGTQYVASYISAIERDKIHPSLKALELIAKRLSEPVEYFLYGGYSNYNNLLPQETLNSQDPIIPAPETNFTLAVRDKLLEVQLLLERENSQGDKASEATLEEANQLLASLPTHQLNDYDRAQLNTLAAFLALQQNKFEEALACLAEALPLATRSKQAELDIKIRLLLSQIHLAQQRPQEAIEQQQVCQRLLAENESLRTPELRLQVLTALANSYLAQGRHEQVVALFEETLQIEKEYNKPQIQADLYRGLADYYRQLGDLGRARRYNILALALYEQLNQYRQTLRLSSSVGGLLTATGRLAEAEHILLRAVKTSQTLQDVNKSELALTYNSLAALRLQQHDLEEARRMSNLAAEEARQGGDRLAEGNALHLAAQVEIQLDHQPEARELYNRAINIMETAEMTTELGDVYKAYGEALSHWGDFEAAVSYLKKAYESKR